MHELGNARTTVTAAIQKIITYAFSQKNTKETQQKITVVPIWYVVVVVVDSEIRPPCAKFQL